MPVTHSQEIFKTRAIKPVVLNPSILEGERPMTSFYGPKSAIKIEKSAPVNLTPPTITGNARIPSVLTCSTGVWSASPQPVFSYQWFIDDVLVSGATGPTFTTYEGLHDMTLSCQVTAENILGSVDIMASNEILAQLVEPINVKENYVYVLRGFSGNGRLDVLHGNTFVLRGLSQEDQLSVFTNDIYALEFEA